MLLKDILVEIKPELAEIEDFHGKNIIDDLGFDSVDIVELLSFIEDKCGIEVVDIENMLDVIQEYDKLEMWMEKRRDKLKV